MRECMHNRDSGELRWVRQETAPPTLFVLGGGVVWRLFGPIVREMVTIPLAQELAFQADQLEASRDRTRALGCGWAERSGWR